MTRPTPRPTPISRPFWDALAEGRLELQRCDACGSLVFYPRLRCPVCAGPALTWEQVAAVGRIATLTVTRQPTGPMFAEDMPQRIAIVELDAGVRMTTTLVEVDESNEPTIGDRVEGRFVRGSDGVTMLHFAPVSS